MGTKAPINVPSGIEAKFDLRIFGTHREIHGNGRNTAAEVNLIVFDPVAAIGMADDAGARLADSAGGAVACRGDKIRGELRTNKFDGFKIEAAGVTGEENIVNTCGAVNRGRDRFEASGGGGHDFCDHRAVRSMEMEIDNAALNLSTARKHGDNRGNPGAEIDSVVAHPCVSIPVTQMADVFSQPFLVVETGSRDGGKNSAWTARHRSEVFICLSVQRWRNRLLGFSHPTEEQNVPCDHKAQEDDYCRKDFSFMI